MAVDVIATTQTDNQHAQPLRRLGCEQLQGLEERVGKALDPSCGRRCAWWLISQKLKATKVKFAGGVKIICVVLSSKQCERGIAMALARPICDAMHAHCTVVLQGCVQYDACC